MANYTITNLKLIQNIGTGIGSTLPLEEDRTLFITPNPGYVVRSSDFTAPTSYPNGIDNIELGDTLTPGEIGNEVFVKLSFNNNVNIEDADAIQNLGIEGDAVLYHKPIFGNKQEIEVYFKVNTSSTNSSVTIKTNSNFTNSNGVLTGKVKPMVKTDCAKITIKADSGYYFENKPVVSTTSTHFVTTISNIVRNFRNRITSYDINIFYVNSLDSYEADSLELDIDAKVEVLDPLSQDIIRVSFGSPYIADSGEVKNISVTAAIYSEWDLEVVRESDNAVIASLSGAKTILKDNEVDYGKSFEVNGVEYDNFEFDIPANQRVNTSSGIQDIYEAYVLTITPATGTSVKNTISDKYLMVQVKDPSMLFSCGIGGLSPMQTVFTNAIPNTTGSSDIIIKGKPNKTAKFLSYDSSLNLKRVVEHTYTTTSVNGLQFDPSQLHHSVLPCTGSSDKVLTTQSNGGEWFDIVLDSAEGMETFVTNMTEVYPPGNRYDGNPFVPGLVRNIDIPNKTVSISATHFTSSDVGQGGSWDSADLKNATFYFVLSSFESFTYRQTWFVPSSNRGFRRDNSYDFTISGLSGEQVDLQTVKIRYNVAINRFGDNYNTFKNNMSNTLNPLNELNDHQQDFFPSIPINLTLDQGNFLTEPNNSSWYTP